MQMNVCAKRSRGQSCGESQIQEPNPMNSSNAGPSEVPYADTTIFQLLSEALLADELDKRPEDTRRGNSFIPSICDQNSSRSKDTAEMFPSIRIVAGNFTRNRLQHHAFRLAARELLKRMYNGCEQKDYALCVRFSRKRDKTFSLYLGSQAGNGKSRVVEALQGFARN